MRVVLKHQSDRFFFGSTLADFGECFSSLPVLQDCFAGAFSGERLRHLCRCSNLYTDDSAISSWSLICLTTKSRQHWQTPETAEKLCFALRLKVLFEPSSARWKKLLR